MRTAAVLVLLGILSTSVQGEPWRRHIVDGSSRGADGVRLTDVNRDGLPDIATGWEEGGVVRAYLNPGPRQSTQPWPAVTTGHVKSPEDAVFVDLDNDGAVDLVSRSCEGKTRTMYAHWAPTAVDKYLDSTAWRTEALPVTQQEQSWMFALPMQVDGIHGADLIVSSKGGNAGVGWLASPAKPRDVAAWTYHRLCDAGWIMSLQAHDMDGDKDLDILFTDRKGPRRGVKWLENRGPGAAAAGDQWPEHRLDAGDREVMFLAVGDVDQDGRRDVACAVKGRGISLITRCDGAGAPFTFHEIAMPDNCGTGKGVAIGDIDLDGRTDIVFSCEHASDGKSGVRWLSYPKSVGDSVWADHEISGPVGIKFDRLDLLDLDADGDLDVLTCEEREINAVVWYENPTRSRE